MKKENIPNVIKLKGKVIIFKIGFIINEIKEKTKPANIKVDNPPIILTPENI